MVATFATLELLAEAGLNPAALLDRHVVGDWGGLCDEDRQENEFSLNRGFRLLSSYPLPSDHGLWIIT